MAGLTGCDNLLTRDQFVDILGKVVAAHDMSRDIQKTIRDSAKRTDGDMVVDFFDPFVLYSGQLNSLVRTLEVMFRDTENEWISWWLFDCDYGHDRRLLSSVTDSEGNAIPMGTLGDLYDCLVRSMEESRAEI